MALGRSSRSPYVHPRRGPANGERLNVDELVVESCVVDSSAEESLQREWRTGDGGETSPTLVKDVVMVKSN
jgi:hypothetical protein